TVGVWAAYGLAAALGLYSHPFFSLVIVVHGIYAALIARPRLTGLFAYLAASATALLAYTPWMIPIATQMLQHPVRARQTVPLEVVLTLLPAWSLDVLVPFVDLDVVQN